MELGDAAFQRAADAAGLEPSPAEAGNEASGTDELRTLRDSRLHRSVSNGLLCRGAEAGVQVWTVRCGDGARKLKQHVM